MPQPTDESLYVPAELLQHLNRGDCVLFVKRDHTQLRALMGDGIGLYLVTRRFEGGRVRVLQTFSERPMGAAISTGELSLLLEGARFTVHKRAPAWKGQARRRGRASELWQERVQGMLHTT